MRQTLFYIPDTCFGLPVFGWGLGLILLLAAVIVAHVYQFAKHRTINDVGSSLAFLGIGGALIVFVLPNLAEPGKGIPIRGYGFCLLIAIFAALSLVLYLSKRQNIAAEKMYSLCFWAVISGIIGARLFYVTEYWQEMLRFDAAGKILWQESLVSAVNVTQGGLTVFGSILGGIIGTLIFMRRNKMPMLRTFDMMAPALMLGIAIGRIGCLLNGCCFGGITDLPWAIVFPAGSPAHVHQLAHGEGYLYGIKFAEQGIKENSTLIVEKVLPNSEAESQGIKPNMVLRYIVGEQSNRPMVWEIRTRQQAAELLTHIQKMLPAKKVQFDFVTDEAQSKIVSYQLTPSSSPSMPVHPTQIYSSCLALILCGTLLALGRLRFYREYDGRVLATFMILYSLCRFLIEMIRTDEDSFLGTGLTVSQNVSLIFCFAGIILFLYLCKTQGKKGCVKL